MVTQQRDLGSMHVDGDAAVWGGRNLRYPVEVSQCQMNVSYVALRSVGPWQRISTIEECGHRCHPNKEINTQRNVADVVHLIPT